MISFFLNLDQWFRMSFRDSLSGALAALCLAEQNHLCNFGREYQEKQFCEMI